MRNAYPQEIQYYQTLNEQSPFIEWLESIQDRKTQQRIRTRIERLKFGSLGDVKFIGEGVFEMRLHFGAGYRIYFGKVDNTIVLLLCGGDKSSQTRDIERAKNYWREYTEENQ